MGKVILYKYIIVAILCVQYLYDCEDYQEEVSALVEEVSTAALAC